MFVTAIKVRGLRDLPELHLTGLGRVVRVRGPSPATTALGDALELFFAALSPPRLRRALQRSELLGPAEQPEIIEDGLPVQASWRDREAAGALVEPGADSRTVTLHLHLDPPLFRLLSDQAAREPRLVSALGEGGSVRVTVGALLATSLDVLSISVTGFEVGGERFPTTDKERPAWLLHFLRALADRYNRAEPWPDDLARRVMHAALSRRDHAAFLGWQATLAPLYGVVRPVLGPGGHPTLLADDLPLRRHGPSAITTAALAADAWLHPCDLLWIDEGPAMMESLVEGDASCLDQVFRVCPEGEVQPTPRHRDTPPLRHPGRRR